MSSNVIAEQLETFQTLSAILANKESSTEEVALATQTLANGDGLNDLYALINEVHKSRVSAKKALAKDSSLSEESSSEESEKPQKKKESKPSLFTKSNKVLFIQNFVGSSKEKALVGMASSLKELSFKYFGKSGESSAVFPLHLVSEAGFKQGSNDPLLLKIGTSNPCTFGKKCKKKDEADKNKCCTYKHADELVQVVPKSLLVNIYEQAIKCEQAGICSKRFYLLRTIAITLALFEADIRGCEISF